MTPYNKVGVLSSDPRKAALFILNTLDQGNKTLDQVLDSLLSENPDMAKRDKALLHTLVYGVLRYRGRLDWVISTFSKTHIQKIDPSVLNILRLGLFQFMFLDRVPVSAAVNTAVEMAKDISAPWVVKYVNGVLRNASRGYKDVLLPKISDGAAKALAVSESFPLWLIKRWLERFGLEETKALLIALNEIPPMTVRTNTLKTDRETLLNGIREHFGSTHIAARVPEGICLTAPAIPVAQLEAFKKGWFAVQDEGAQVISHFLNPKPGETILDACAGLGGKTGHIAQLMENKGKIIAADKSAQKLSALTEDMLRLGFTIILPQLLDLTANDDERATLKFDKVLLDAPCSGLGVIRRNPDTKWRMKPEKFKDLSRTQNQLLNHLSNRVKPGGVLVYTVCSMEPEENEDVVQLFLKNHGDFFVEKPTPPWPDWIKSLMDKRGYLRTYPHQHGMDGFFAVRLKRLD
ncbi:MAG: 16S rRNA (cytosine(967)-C(5))-methyltransferase RsmB [Desulfobacteraceae bacterium]|nr:16S rRNA (cytosine(967)-C(5))-methyltransferase RsmB [Desulfobacteraceae bacterium]